MGMNGARGLGISQQFEQINGSPQYIGTIQSTGANVISNITSLIRPGDRLLLQPDAVGYFHGADSPSTPTVTNSSTTGVKLASDEKAYICLRSEETHLQWISASGTTNLKVFRLV